jgi:hypothetical protein
MTRVIEHRSGSTAPHMRHIFPALKKNRDFEAERIACPPRVGRASLRVRAEMARNRSSNGRMLRKKYRVEWARRPVRAAREGGRHKKTGDEGENRPISVIQTLAEAERRDYTPPPEMDGWPSGRRRTPGKCVYLKRVSWVRIPPRPPEPLPTGSYTVPSSLLLQGWTVPIFPLLHIFLHLPLRAGQRARVTHSPA